jgi:stress-induced morphogen
MKYFHKLFAAVANSQISRVNIGRQMSTSQGISSKIEQAIREHFQPKHLEVLDVSGGCGQSFNVHLSLLSYISLS